MMVGSVPMALKWTVLGVGLVAHLAGMVGRRRIQHEQSDQLARWERVGYWVCWGLIAALIVYAATVAVWGLQ